MSEFSERNRLRCEAADGFDHALNSWSLSDWYTATSGELGEAGNIIKKLNRVRDGIPGNKESEPELRAMLADELADVRVYLDLLTQAAGFDLDTITEAKFAKTSAKIGYDPRPSPPKPIAWPWPDVTRVIVCAVSNAGCRDVDIHTPGRKSWITWTHIERDEIGVWPRDESRVATRGPDGNVVLSKE